MAVGALEVGGAHAGTIDRLGWLAGCWAYEPGDRLVQEQWLRPLGRSMVGISRIVANQRTQAFEYMRIEEHDSLLVYVASPSGQEVTVFRQEELTDSLVVFENLQHDFPQRIRYRLMEDGSMLAQLHGAALGKSRTVSFSMKRVACDGPPPASR